MMAGAFAGIAVSIETCTKNGCYGLWLMFRAGALRHVSHRPPQGMEIIVAKEVEDLEHMLTPRHRHACKSSTLRPQRYTVELAMR